MSPPCCSAASISCCTPRPQTTRSGMWSSEVRSNCVDPHPWRTFAGMKKPARSGPRFPGGK
jgi:hypothetical protein